MTVHLRIPAKHFFSVWASLEKPFAKRFLGKVTARLHYHTRFRKFFLSPDLQFSYAPNKYFRMILTGRQLTRFPKPNELFFDNIYTGRKMNQALQPEEVSHVDLTLLAEDGKFINLRLNHYYTWIKNRLFSQSQPFPVGPIANTRPDSIGNRFDANYFSSGVQSQLDLHLMDLFTISNRLQAVIFETWLAPGVNPDNLDFFPEKLWAIPSRNSSRISFSSSTIRILIFSRMFYIILNLPGKVKKT